MTLKPYILVYLSFQIDSKSKIIQFYSWICSFARTSSQFLRKMTCFLIFLEGRPEISEMRKKIAFSSSENNEGNSEETMSCYIEFSISSFFLSDLARVEDFLFQKPVEIQVLAIRLESV